MIFEFFKGGFLLSIPVLSEISSARGALFFGLLPLSHLQTKGFIHVEQT